MNSGFWSRAILIASLAAALCGCQVFGMAGAVRITGQTFDEAECLARDFKGEEPCPQREP